MKRMIFPVMALLAGAPALARAAAPVAGTPGEASECPGFAGGHAEHMASKLGLDPTAKAKFEETNQKYFGQMKPVWQDVKQKDEALKAELAKPKPDESQLTKLSDGITSDREKIASLEQDRLNALKSELTPEQYAKLLVTQHEMAGRFHHEMHGGAPTPTPGE